MLKFAKRFIDCLESEQCRLVKKDLWKALPLLLVALIFLHDNPNLPVIAYAIGIVILLALVSHLVRRILFWEMSLQSTYKRAIETPLGAAIVFAAMIFFLSTVFDATVQFLT